MKAVILAGGLGTRMREETKDRPKPMVCIGEKPILWYIMKRYAAYGISDFIICTGYKGDVVTKYFEKKENRPSSWNIVTVDTGLDTMTGGRLKRVGHHLDETFCFTYGDTLNDLNISELISFHRKNKKLATVTACHPPAKFGVLKLEDSLVIDFKEKPTGDGNWVNGGYFVLEPQVLDYIKDDSTVWEHEPLERLVRENQLGAFRHTGFYQPIDTISDKNHLEDLLKTGKAKWEIT